MKLFTIGDSLAQGFMSGAAARTDLAFSTLIARILNIPNYSYPSWPKGGLPVNIELILRKAETQFGHDVQGPLEWVQFLVLIGHYLNEVEDHYERGSGSEIEDAPPFHNIAVRGFNVADAWQIRPSLCEELIREAGSSHGLFSAPSASLMRTAWRVLKTGSPAGSDFSSLDWFEYHHVREGVENLILNLGSNNALGTVVKLEIKQTSEDGSWVPNNPDHLTYRARKSADKNLWHPEDFRRDYRELLKRSSAIISKNPAVATKVFVCTVPLVTIVPLIKAVESAEKRTNLIVKEWRVDPKKPAPMGKGELSKSSKRKLSYAQHYTYFPFADEFDIRLKHLNFGHILHIDNTIRAINRVIQEEVAEANKKMGQAVFHLVDVATALSDMASKRNNGAPTYEFPSYFDFCFPRIDSKYYGVSKDGIITAGGIFSLDGVHPTAIGQGILAREYLKVMHHAGVIAEHPDRLMDWKAIFATDDLRNKPIRTIEEAYQNTKMAQFILDKIGLI